MGALVPYMGTRPSVVWLLPEEWSHHALLPQGCRWMGTTRFLLHSLQFSRLVKGLC